MDEIWPLIIIGGGPAGLSAAVNARKRNKRVLVVAKEQVSHKLMAAPRVDNYLGLPEISGAQLGQRYFDHAQALGAEFARDEIQQVFASDGIFWLMGRERQYQAKMVLLAVGVSESKDIPGESEFVGRGVSYCATCDGAFFKDEDVAMISHLPEAENDARFLSGICRNVFYIPMYRGASSDFGANVSVVAEKPTRIEGENSVERLVLGERSLTVKGVFIERPGVPPAKLIEGLEMAGEHIAVNEDMETSVPGVFAAGDCTGRPWQIGRAVGQGQIAAIAVSRRLESIKT